MAKQRAPKVTEHDAVVRALERAVAQHDRVIVLYPGVDADDVPSRELPDLILSHSRTHRVLRVLAVETRCSMTRPRSERWHELARRAPLTLVVPDGTAREAECLLWSTDARIVEYKRADDGEIVFRPAL